MGTMENPRRYGKPPFTVAVVHGGPGAGGEMAPVARELALVHGVLEPIQTAATLDGQVEELASRLKSAGDPPFVLIGHSWGAWLACLTAARFPALVKKLILVSSGPFEEKYAAALEATRLSRLSADERVELESILASLNDPGHKDKDPLFGRFDALIVKTDACDPLVAEAGDEYRLPFRGDIFEAVWSAAAGLRRSGELLALTRRIACPVVAIHGDWDPHPAEGVEKPLAAAIKDFRFILLKRCGHTPWLEKQAREDFFRIVLNELAK